MIKNLTIDNFRSIKHESIDLGSMNFIIGPNNAGKSNIMRALDLVLGDTYPSVRSFENKDFHNYNKSSPITISVQFDHQLNCNGYAYGFKLSFDGNNCEYNPIDNYGAVLTYRGGNVIRVSNEMKEEVSLMYLGLDRQANQQVRPSQWTLYGKLLRYIEKKIDPAKKTGFKTGVQISYDTNISPDLKKVEDILKEHVKQQTGLDLHLRLSILDPLETIKNIKPYIKEDAGAEEYDAEDVGAGTQSAIAIAIAKAYGEIVKKPLIMAIEEPELYLHPHGCRHFYKMLKNLPANGVQIICTTHDRCFVDISNYQSIHIARKEKKETKITSGINKAIAPGNILKLISKFDEAINEIFFARHVCHGAGKTIQWGAAQKPPMVGN